MSFNDKINQIYEVIQKKKDSGDLDSAMKLVSGMLEIVEKQYSKSFNELLESKGVSQDLALWTKFSLEFNQGIESLEIDPWKNIVKLELGDEVIEAPVYNISEYVQAIPDLTPAQKLLISSYLGNSVNFKIVQIYHNFLK